MAEGLARGLTNYGDRGLRALPAPLLRALDGLFDARCWPGRSSASRTRRSGFNNCHRHFPELIEAVKRGVLAAGGLPIEFPTISLGEVFLEPDQHDVPQPHVDGRRGDDPRPADGRGRAGRRLRQDGAGAAHGRGLGRRAGDPARRRPDDDRAPPTASAWAPAPTAGASGRSYRAGEVTSERDRRRSRATSRPRRAPAP